MLSLVEHENKFINMKHNFGKSLSINNVSCKLFQMHIQLVSEYIEQI